MTNPQSPRAADEALIARHARKAASMFRQAYAMARADVNDADATEVYDECRDYAWDSLLADGGADMVDALLDDVVDSAVALVLS